MAPRWTRITGNRNLPRARYANLVTQTANVIVHTPKLPWDARIRRSEPVAL